MLSVKLGFHQVKMLVSDTLPEGCTQLLHQLAVMSWGILPGYHGNTSLNWAAVHSNSSNEVAGCLSTSKSFSADHAFTTTKTEVILNDGAPRTRLTFRLNSVKSHQSVKKYILSNKYSRYLHKTNTIVFTIYFTIKQTKFQLSSTIIA